MTITAPLAEPVTDKAAEPVSARPHWRRHRFADPKPPPRDKWHRQRHEDEFVAIAEAQRISPAASWMHQVAIARTNPQLSDLQTTTLKDLATAIGRSISSVTRYRRELKDAGVEEHEHRCVRNADGTILGLPNKIRFTLPPDAQARLDARTQTAELDRHTKGRPTPDSPSMEATQSRNSRTSRRMSGLFLRSSARSRAAMVLGGTPFSRSHQGRSAMGRVLHEWRGDDGPGGCP